MQSEAKEMEPAHRLNLRRLVPGTRLLAHGELVYLKGQLRVVTTLAVLAVIHQKNAAVQEAPIGVPRKFC